MMGPMSQGSQHAAWGPYGGPGQLAPPAPWPGVPAGPPVGGQLSSLADVPGEALEAATRWADRAAAGHAAAETDLRALLRPGGAPAPEDAYERALEATLVLHREAAAARRGVEAAAFAERWWAPQLSGSLFRLTAGDLKRAMERGNVDGDWLLHPLPPEGAKSAAADGGFDQAPLRASLIVETLDALMLEAMQAKANARAAGQRYGVGLALHQSPAVAAAAARQAKAVGGGATQERLEGHPREGPQAREKREMPPPPPRAPRSGPPPRQQLEQLQLEGPEEHEEDEEDEASVRPQRVSHPPKRLHSELPTPQSPDAMLLRQQRKRKATARPRSGGGDDGELGGLDAAEAPRLPSGKPPKAVSTTLAQKQRNLGRPLGPAKSKKSKQAPLGPNGCWRSTLCVKDYRHRGKCSRKASRAVLPAGPAPHAAAAASGAALPAAAPAGKAPASVPWSVSEPSEADDGGEDKGEAALAALAAAAGERQRQARRDAGRQCKRQLSAALPLLSPASGAPHRAPGVPLGPNGCWRSARCYKEDGHAGWCNAKAEVPAAPPRQALGPNGCWAPTAAACDKEGAHFGPCNEAAAAPQGPDSPSHSISLELSMGDDDGESDTL